MRQCLAFSLAALLVSCLAERGPLTNRMAHSATAYLSRAARHPVGWQPWGREAFALAARLDRPILLYIGADDCGWCVRMDRESYADPAVGALIDSLFVPVRVDRDERPDIARRYQAALQTLAGLRGYPVTIFLTPDGSPFFGGTYFPSDDPITGRGLRQVLPEVARSYREQREIIRRQAALVRQLAVVKTAASHGVVRPELVDAQVAELARAVEAATRAPEALWTFPYGQSVALLLSEFGRFGDTAALRIARAALAVVVDSLDARGPGGEMELSPELARALLLRNLAAAWVLTADPELRRRAAPLLRALALRLEVPPPERPVFADRDAYVVAAVIEGGLALGDTAAAGTARRALDGLLDRVYAPGQGVRHAVVGSIAGLLQDQVQVAAACLAAYEAFGDDRYLAVAVDLAAVLERDFADPEGGYFDSVHPDPAAPALADRTKQVLDDLLPGANAWAARVLLRLADVTGERRYAQRAEAALAAFAGAIGAEGVRAASYLTAARDALVRR
ncbi:MAG TPA: DUF255 domain-containing protein [Gemmatimonadales bacterium]|nr:DUF255 domain-containing protein [Gemmatimonadales bacterium]